MPVPRAWLQGSLLALLALAVYVPALGCGFVWDDDSFLTANPLIHAADGLWRFWWSTEPPDYFPLTSTTLWLEWRAWGADPRGYHAVNVALHALSTVVVWRALLALELPGAWIAAALFAVHPVNVESVAWITQRKSTLPMVFYALSILSYLRADAGESAGLRRSAYACALGAFLLALLAKSSVVMLPIVLLGCAWWRRGRVTTADLWRTAPFFALALVLGLVTAWYQSHSSIQDQIVRDDGFWSRMAIAGRAVWFYLGKALLPLDLCFVYPRWRTGAVGWSSLAPLAALFLVGWVAWRFRKSWSRPYLAALGYYTACLLPVLGLLDIYFMRFSLVADHYQYFASIGVAALAGAGLARLSRATGRRTTGSIAAAALIGLLAAQTWHRQAAYRDAETLWLDTLECNPDAWIAHTNLAAMYFERGQSDKALLHDRLALEIEPDLYETLYNYAVLLAERGDVDQAIDCLERALELRPSHYPAAHNLGFLLRRQGQLAEARAAFRRGIQGQPFDARLYLGIGLTFLDEGDREQAMEHFRMAQACDPSFYGPWLEQAEVEERFGSPLEAAVLFEAAAERHPDPATRRELAQRAQDLRRSAEQD